MKCIDCGKFPFCPKIQDSQQEACKEEFRKRKIMITTKSVLTNRTIIERIKDE